jgi:uncharacterized protein CbrC (UPF0167 family)
MSIGDSVVFKYFRDPENFAFKIDSESTCSICDKSGIWLDAEGYSGINEIKCICDECLSVGKLLPLEISANQVDIESKNSDEIIYRTPALPSWQDQVWPYLDGDYCVFEKLASKLDFLDKNQFKQSFSDIDQKTSDLDWLWDMVPDTIVSNLEDGNYDVSVYLFSRNDKKHCTWDAN